MLHPATIYQMFKSLFSGLLFALFLFPLSAYPQGHQNYFQDRLLIKYESDQKLQKIQHQIGANPKTAVQQMLSLSGARLNQPLVSHKLQQTIQEQQIPGTNEIGRIEEVFFSRNIDVPQLASKISRMPGVAYAEPKYIRNTGNTPNDPKFQESTFTYHNFIEAWDISQGSSDIVIAVVDAGVDYTHPDLDKNLWINQKEVPTAIFDQVDQNGDGQITATEVYQHLGTDYNGDGSITLEDALHADSDFTDNFDNDDNSFVDDLFGWDFWESGSTSNNIIQDNNPIHTASDHGTHVTGIAAAETNNSEGVAGAAYNATFMPVKAGGASGSEDAIGFGFEGILYAAQNGADIINCSWSGDTASEAEEEIINLATQMGALVVGAAGNETGRTGYPARYDKVLAVGSVESNDSRASYSNFGYNLDVLATGTDILSTSFDHNYISKSGTSMSAPVVSGLAALVKEQHPDWSAERIGIQIRTSSRYIDDSNTNLENQLGHGAVDADRALTTDLPGLKVVSFNFLNNAGKKLSLGEEGTIGITVTNIGKTTSSLTIELESLNESSVSLSNTRQQLGSIAIGDTLDISFPIRLPADFGLTELPTFKLSFYDSNSDYNDFNVIIYENMFFEILAANNIKTSFGADGTWGFSDPMSARGGVGFIPRYLDGSDSYREGENLLFEGGLIMAMNDDLFDAVRTSEGRVSRDFLPKDAVTVTPINDDDLKGHTRFVTHTDSARRARINLQTFAYDDPEINKVVFAKYIITNPSPYMTMKNMYVGLFNDWDIGGNPGNNNISYSESDSILYISDATSPNNQPVVAVAHLGPLAGALAIDNTLEGRQDSITFGLYDGFTDNEKRASLSSGTVRTALQNTDVSAVTSSGPYTLNPEAQITVGFVYAFGNDPDELRTQIAAARSRNLFEVSPAGRITSDKIPEQTKLFQNYPNPFKLETEVHFNLAQNSHVTLTVYDVLGRKIRVLVDQKLEAGAHFYSFNSLNLSSGIYFAHLVTERGTKTIPMTKIKAL